MAEPEHITQLPPLLRRYPELHRRVGWVPIGEFPTPVEKLKRLGALLGIQELWVKRDDQSGTPYGGNKVRKMEFLLGDMLAKNKRRILAYGPTGSNWAVACLVYGALHGIPTELLLFHRPLHGHGQRNLELDYQLAEKLQTTRSVLTLPFHLAAGVFRGRKRATYLMPPGGTSPLTTLGYVNAALELREQIEAGMMPEPHYIFVPLGTGGTAAGLAIGARLAGLRSRIMSVRVADMVVANGLVAAGLANRTLRLIRRNCGEPLDWRVSPRDIQVLHHFIGKGYGIPSREGMAASNLVRQAEGIYLDPTYTGKTMAGLINFVKTQPVRNSVVLFWNTVNSHNLDEIVKQLTSAGKIGPVG